MIKMKFYRHSKIITIFIFITFFSLYFSPASTTILEKDNKQKLGIIEGNILFSPMQSTKTYLIDCNGQINHTWSSNYLPGEAAYLLDDGTLLRTIKLSLSGGGAGGGVQKITWDGSLIWDFRYYTDSYLSHHDIEPLPNGNLLMIAWEYFSKEEAIAAGRDPNKLNGNTIKPDHIIEVEPTGPTTGDIVWKWHAWDHLIQDYDPSKENYGVVEDHPELIDINFGSQGADWLHSNSIDYNEELDQILLSVREFNEIWVIDHSTTTEEAAGHTGGNIGKGGDILYRWGNPRAYGAGTFNDQIFFAQHDARWISPDCPCGGNILVFNNLGGYPEGFFTTVDEIEPPLNENGSYYIEPGYPYGPEEQTWIYDADFYSWYVGGSLRISNGNTIICNGPSGYFIEVSPEGDIVWEYENPYPTPLNNEIFKFEYYPPIDPSEEPDLKCSGSIEGKKIKVGATFNDSFEVRNVGSPESLLNWQIKSYPEWGNWTFNIESGENLTPEEGSKTIDVSIVIPNEKNKKFEGYVTVENKEDPDDFDVVMVSIKTSTTKYFLNPIIHQLFTLFEKFFTSFNYILNKI
jgi:hypothetical protein